MKRRVQDYLCPECGWRSPHLIELADDVPNSMDSCPEEAECFACDSRARRVFSAPATMLRAAVPDGTDRGDGWRVARDLARARSASFSLPPDKRGDLHREMASLERASAKVDHRNRQEPSKKYTVKPPKPAKGGEG